MNREFKFKYANEIAGSFVLVALILMVFGILFTGHYRGWFENRFEVNAVFETDEGTFGLREGDEVRVGNTKAGTVREISPTESGKIEAIFEIKERFKPLVRKDSVASVKKKFYATGDSYVEIQRGSKAAIEDGDYINVKQDQELMDRLQHMLTEVEKVTVPMLDEVRQILEHVNGIVASVDTGKGLVGAAITDSELRDRTKSIVVNVDNMSMELTNTVKRLDLLVASVEKGRGIAGKLLHDEQMADKSIEIVETVARTTIEAEKALLETRRLVEGLQKHWLVRKYVKHDKGSKVIPVIYLKNELAEKIDEYSDSLRKARIEDNGKLIAESAYKLAVAYFLTGNDRKAGLLLSEARMELGHADNVLWCDLLDARIKHENGETSEAEGILEHVLKELRGWSYDKDARLFAHIQMLEVLTGQDNESSRRRHAMEVADYAQDTGSPVLAALADKALGDYYSSVNNHKKAAVRYANAANTLKGLNNFDFMRGALVEAADSYEAAGEMKNAAFAYFKAGRSYYATELYKGKANKLIDKAIDNASKLEDHALVLKIRDFRMAIE